MGWLKLKLPAFWEPSAYNAMYWVMEERARDGRYRHRSIDDHCRLTPWVDGPHPIAQKLRDEGKEESPGFRRQRQHQSIHDR